MPQHNTQTVRLPKEAIERIDRHAERLAMKRPGEVVSRTAALVNLIFENVPEPRDEPTPQPAARRSKKGG